MNISRSEASAGSAENDWRELNTTPEFREFVGKKLDHLVAGMIKEKDRCKHLQPIEVEGGVRLFSGAPIIQAVEELFPEAPPQPPAKRPKLAGVDLQRYQLKKKSRRDPAASKSTNKQDEKALEADATDSIVKTSSSSNVDTPTDCERADDGGSSDSSDDEDLARFAEAAVPSDFMASLANSKTVRLGSG